MDESLLSFLLENFGINVVIMVMIASAILFIVNSLPKIMDSLGYFQSRKIKHMNEALNSEWVSDDHKQILKKDISASYIYGTLKIKVSEKETKEIVELSAKTDGRFSTMELYHAINNIGYNFYNLPLEDLESRKTDLEGEQRFDRMIMFLLYLIPIAVLLMFQNVEISWNKYHLLIFGIYLSVLLNIIRYRLAFLKQKENAMRVLNYFIRSFNAN